MTRFSNSPLFVSRSAKFSKCRRYRYSLEIVWDATKPIAAFIGLNPSTADEVDDDPTIRRCRGFAESWGCGGMRMLNLFAFRTPKPKVMLAEDDPGGPENDLRDLLEGVTGPRVACWGTHGHHLEMGNFYREMLPGLQCFGRNRDGSPKHPLYLRSTTRLEKFSKV
jgi:hypothetical protein